jgi:hypothetical protein
MKKRHTFGVLAIALAGLISLTVWSTTRESRALRELQAKYECLARPADMRSPEENVWCYPSGWIWTAFDDKGKVKDKMFLPLRRDLPGTLRNVLGIKHPILTPPQMGDPLPAPEE